MKKYIYFVSYDMVIFNGAVTERSACNDERATRTKIKSIIDVQHLEDRIRNEVRNATSVVVTNFILLREEETK